MASAIVEDIVKSGLIITMDPYLEFQPAFSYTLPIQLLVLGITLTLLCVLAIQLLFTTQYHYPLAPLNYILQLTSILSVLISVVIKIIVILQTSATSADTWPYSLDYVAVSVPPASWSIGQDAAWFLLQAINSGLANITHIQFLTLLYPSVTEARLIVFVLGPLALASSGLTFTALSSSQTTLDLGDAIRNVFNSTLLLIFTIALGLWGLFVNRRRAWRFDGGTAMFGSGAIFLAIVSTSFNFVAVREDGIDWLQHLLYAAILWQTWLGWWWWVGSGMGIGEVEDIMERAERKKRKTAKRAARHRADANARAKANANSSSNSNNGAPGPLAMKRTATMASVSEFGHASASAMAGFTTSVAGILRGRNGTLSRRHTSQVDDAEVGLAGREGAENIEMDGLRRTVSRSASNSNSNSNAASQSQSLNGRGVTRRRTGNHGPLEEQDSTMEGEEEDGTNARLHSRIAGAPTPQVGFSASTYSASRNQMSTNSEDSSTSHTPSLHAPHSVGQFISYPANWLWVYLRRLRRAHEDAAKKQALERAELRQRVFASSTGGGGGGGGAGAGTGPAGSTTNLGIAAGGGGMGLGSGGGVGVGNGSGSGSGSGGEPSGADTPANGVSNPPRPRSTRRGLGGLTEHDVSGLAEEEVGWGLGRFGIREHEESARRLQAAGERLREGRLLGGDGDGEEDDAGDALGRRRGSRASGGGGHTPRGEASRRSSRSRQGVSAARRSSVPAVLGPVAVVHPELMTNDESIEGENGAMAGPGPSTVHRSARDRDREREGGSEWEDIDGSSGSSSDERRDRDRRPRAGAGIGSRWGRRRSRQRQDVDHAAGAIEGERKTTGWSWWGPLKEWRLADRSAF